MIDYIGIARKAVECADMVKLLEGKGEYRCEFYYYGFPPDADVTDWNNLISRGIYAQYTSSTSPSHISLIASIIISGIQSYPPSLYSA